MTALTTPLNFRLIFLEETTSTNDEAQKLAKEGAPSFSVVVSKRMTQGRGRFNRKWAAPEGNLFWSCVLHKKDYNNKPTSDLSFVAAIAVFNFIQKHNPDAKVKIKWPNDVLVEIQNTHKLAPTWAKVSGILVESFTHFSVVGIGINLAHTPDIHTTSPESLSATNLKDLGINLDLGTAINELCQQFYKTYTDWQEHGLQRLAALYNVHAWRMGEPLTVSLNPEKTNLITGINRGILSSGTLCLEQQNHDIVEINAGDVLNLTD